MAYTLEDIHSQADFRLLNVAKIFIGPVSLERLQFMPGKLSFDQIAITNPFKG